MHSVKKSVTVRLAALLLAMIIGLCGFGVSGQQVSAASGDNDTIDTSVSHPKNGWDAEKKHYYENGKMVTGKKRIDGYWYYFNKKGVAQKNKFVTFKKQKKTCYYDENGHAVKGLRKIGKYYYYFNKRNYAMAVSKFVTNSKKTKTYYFNAKGRRVKGLKKIKKKYYYFDKSTGLMKTKGFQKVTRDGKEIICYFGKNGAMVTGDKAIKGVIYSFDKKTGALETMMIAHASGDENGDYYNGRAGDQTLIEVCVRSWYNRPWSCVLRPKDPQMAEKIATAMENAANNNNIGYDMNDRNTLYYAAQKTGWDPGKVTTLCETDCSALVSVACMYAGIKPSVLFQSGNSSVTWNLKDRLMGTGKFTLYTTKAHIAGTGKLKRGDILLYEGHHTGVVTGVKQF